MKATNDKANIAIVELEIRKYPEAYYIHINGIEAEWTMRIEVTKLQAENTSKAYNLKIHKHEN